MPAFPFGIRGPTSLGTTGLRSLPLHISFMFHLSGSYLWEAYPPPFTSWEKTLADLAYVKMDRLGLAVTPFKRPRGGKLTELQEAFNSVHSWCLFGHVELLHPSSQRVCFLLLEMRCCLWV